MIKRAAVVLVVGIVLLKAAPASALKLAFGAYSCGTTQPIERGEDDDPELDYLQGQAHSEKAPGLPATYGPIFCPIVGNGSPVLSVDLSVWDKSSAANVSCTLTTYDANGVMKYAVVRNTASYNFNNPMSLQWSSITGGGTYAMLKCSLLTKSGTGNGGQRSPLVFYSATF
jgi:hypothetical protein